MISQIKLYIFGAVILIIIGIISYAINEFHYEPINLLNKSIAAKDKELTSKQDVIKAYEKAITEIYGNLYLCEQNVSKSKLDGIIEGLGGDDETDVIIDFDNINY